jgi:hypothetical protein
MRTLVIAAALGMLGVVARRPARSAPEPEPPPPREPRRPAVHAAIEPALPAIDPDDPADDPDTGIDVADALANAGRELADRDQLHNAVLGHVIDAQTSEPIAGAVIIVASPALEHPQAAISDDQGNYAITTLPTGRYDVTLYYGDLTLEYPQVAVSDLAPTRLLPVGFGPVPGRTFETTLGAASGSQEDGLGVSFSGVTTLENTYYVDGVDVTE